MEDVMKSRFYVCMVATIICYATLVPAQVHKDDQKVLILLPSSQSDTLKNVTQIINELGGQVVHIHPPHVLIGYLEPSKDAELSKRSLIQIYRQMIDPSSFSAYGNEVVNAIFAWNNNFMGMARANGLEAEPIKPPRPLTNCILGTPNEPNGPQSRLAKPQGAGFYDVSEFLYGSISVNVILVESTGNGENWSAAREANVVSEIQAAMNWWYNRDTRANLSFIYHFIYGRTDSSAQTSYEPITTTTSNHYLWINEIMGNFGYTSGSSEDRTTSYVNDKINSDNTNWGFLVFVVDDLNDSDNMFPGNYFAYTFLGGPYIVMTYDNDSYLIANMDAVTAHEFGHEFYAMDEYSPGGQSCNAYSGYLNVQNRNSLVGGCPDLGLACIMRGQIAPYTSGLVCSYSRETVGWRDSNGNNIFDVVDTYPNTVLNAFSPDPTYDKTPYYTGTAADVPLNNLNPFGSGNDISVNKITNIQYRIDGGVWLYASGTTNYSFLALTSSSASLADGLHTIETQAQNSLGRWDGSPASDQLTTQGHLRSNSTLSTTYNNQRKMVYASTTYHMVYEDEGEIYYTTSTDNGATWSTEIFVSDGSGTNKYPALDFINQIVIVLWQQELSGSGKIFMRRKYSGVWQPQQEVAAFLASSGFTATPVVSALGTFYYLVVWRDYDSPGLRIRAFNENNDTWGTATAIPSTNSNSFYPTISKDTYEFCHLAWAESGTIYYTKNQFQWQQLYFQSQQRKCFEWHV